MIRLLLSLGMTLVVSLAIAGDYYSYRSQPGRRCDEQRVRIQDRQRACQTPYAITIRQAPQKEPQGYDRIRNHMAGRSNQVEQEKSTILVVPPQGSGYHSPVIIRERQE